MKWNLRNTTITTSRVNDNLRVRVDPQCSRHPSVRRLCVPHVPVNDTRGVQSEGEHDNLRDLVQVFWPRGLVVKPDLQRVSDQLSQSSQAAARTQITKYH